VIAYPAIDLRGGRVVQLVGGRPENERVSRPDPLAVAEEWIACGFRMLHVVDLDAALGHGDNRRSVLDLIGAVGVPVQVGGGIRDDDTADALLAAGAARVIVGTRAVEEPAWLAEIAARYPARVILAADIRGDAVVTRGWTTTTSRSIASVLDRLEAIELAAVLVTDVSREGRMTGTDAAQFARLADRTALPLIAAGGIRCMQDLRALRDAGVAGAVLGMALYTGAIDATAAAREFTE
jgi:phosphoribosylformimino-5-aminoimidazole carboxamide ribotide isomerase